jgi:Family of unknown function (DUF6223)
MITCVLRTAIDHVVTCLVAAALVGGIGIAAPAAAQVSDQPRVVSAHTLTPKRITASGAAMVGLIGAAIGGLALARSAGRIGTGNGIAGGIVAVILGLIGIALGGLALGRSRRIA